eukprot:scaffold324_cov326-Pavlova_lutheri.AAC.59
MPSCRWGGVDCPSAIVCSAYRIKGTRMDTNKRYGPHGHPCTERETQGRASGSAKGSKTGMTDTQKIASHGLLLASEDQAFPDGTIDQQGQRSIILGAVHGRAFTYRLEAGIRGNPTSHAWFGDGAR